MTDLVNIYNFYLYWHYERPWHPTRIVCKVIAADGEQKAASALRDAAEVMSLSSAALQLRYLQVLFIKHFTRGC